MSRYATIVVAPAIALLLATLVQAAPAPTRAELNDALAEEAYGEALAIADALLAAEPDAADVRFARARVRYRLGNIAGSADDYASLAREFPENVDYVFGLALALAALRDDDAALDALGRASRLAPHYEDVWRLEHRLRARQPDADSDSRLRDLRDVAAKRFPGSDWYRVDDERPSRRWELQVGFGHDDLSGDRPDWASRFAGIARITAGGDRYSLRVAHEERFQRTDRHFGIGADWRVDTDWTVGLAASVATNSDFSADHQLGAHAGRPLGSGWTVDVAIRRRDFPDTFVDSYTLLTEKYFGDFRAAGAVSMTHLQAAGNSLGYSLYFNWYPRPALMVGVVGTTGAEAEVVDAGPVIETDVSGFALTGRYRFGRRWTIDAWLGTHEQGDFYRRRYAGMAVTIGL